MMTGSSGLFFFSINITTECRTQDMVGFGFPMLLFQWLRAKDEFKEVFLEDDKLKEKGNK